MTSSKWFFLNRLREQEINKQSKIEDIEIKKERETDVNMKHPSFTPQFTGINEDTMIEGKMYLNMFRWMSTLVFNHSLQTFTKSIERTLEKHSEYNDNGFFD